MQHTTTWHIAVHITHVDGQHTEAEAVLRTDADIEMRHAGTANRRPHDTDQPEVGDALAVSHALSGLAHDLFAASIDSGDPEPKSPLAEDVDWAGLG